MTSHNLTSTSQTNCTSDANVDAYLYVTNIAVAVINVPIAIITTVCNALVLLTVIKTKRLHRPAQLLLCSLSLNDFFVGFLVLPLFVALRIMENSGVNCSQYYNVGDAFFASARFFIVGSFLQLCVMSWDRSKAVSTPLRYRTTVTNRKILAIITVAWSTWLIAFLLLKFISLPGNMIIVALTMTFTIIIGAFQLRSISAIRHLNQQIATEAGSHATSVIIAREKKMAVTSWYILAGALGSNVPILIVNAVVIISGNSAFRVRLSPWSITAVFLSSSLNPLIYFWRHSDMRSAALVLLGW